MRFTLPKSEILRGFQSFTRVITEGRSFSVPPIRCYCCIQKTGKTGGTLVGFSVSRSVRRAVDRNRAKRLMREAFRLNKNLISQVQRGPEAKSRELVFMFTGPANSLRGKKSFENVHRSIVQIVTRIAEEE